MERQNGILQTINGIFGEEETNRKKVAVLSAHGAQDDVIGSEKDPLYESYVLVSGMEREDDVSTDYSAIINSQLYVQDLYEENQSLEVEEINSNLRLNDDLKPTEPDEVFTDWSQSDLSQAEFFLVGPEGQIISDLVVNEEQSEVKKEEFKKEEVTEELEVEEISLEENYSAPSQPPPLLTKYQLVQDEKGQMFLMTLKDLNLLLEKPVPIKQEVESEEEELIIKENVDPEPTETPQKGTDSFCCQLCNVTLATLPWALKHCSYHSTATNFICILCSANFTSQLELLKHFSEHQPKTSDEKSCLQCGMTESQSKENPACDSKVCWNTGKCLLCFVSFRSSERLQFHIKYHENESGSCELCGKVYSNELSLYRHHVYLHSTGGKHRCHRCGKTFRSAGTLKQHSNCSGRLLTGASRLKKHSCDQCGKIFQKKSLLLTHIHTVHRQVPVDLSCFCCQMCWEAFPSTGMAIAHMEHQHQEEVCKISEYCFGVHSVKTIFVCEYCDRHFGEVEALHNHRNNHTDELPYECKICGAMFSVLTGYTEHKQKHENVPIEYSEDFSVPTVYSCEYCKRLYYSYMLYSEHMVIHEGENPYHCMTCSAKFPTGRALSTHQVEHSRQARLSTNLSFECHFCFKAFALEDALVKHIRSHTGEKPFICDQCGKRFSQSSGLYTHLKIHSSERPYSCCLCGRTFKIKGDRDVHFRKHSGARPYRCDVCNKAFMTQHVYSQHVKIHTGERPYKCDICNLAFRRSHVLTVHKRIHTGEKPHVCEVCGKRYRQKGDLSKHKKTQHPVVLVK